MTIPDCFLRLIDENLPPEVAALKDRYPETTSLMAYYWKDRDLDPLYVPEYIAIVNSDPRVGDPDLIWENGEIVWVNLQAKPNLTQVFFGDNLVYVEIDGKVFFDKTSQLIQLPDFFTKASVLAEAIVKWIEFQSNSSDTF